ncbi:hypothetical protein M011DRAFT_487510 [Sporormia fimetaria CBS 119925]|uniref:Uncharacterized protein n=1 Tax=Sporormia fimetaria CBS 119925 TaxID=1340428 RepID=A0A6A6V7E1_9PLEO|nr:hypothetical protein M011DRAFT_487510 [Sporormia fimetaria CBS 119925]
MPNLKEERRYSELAAEFQINNALIANHKYVYSDDEEDEEIRALKAEMRKAKEVRKAITDPNGPLEKELRKCERSLQLWQGIEAGSNKIRGILTLTPLAAFAWLTGVARHEKEVQELKARHKKEPKELEARYASTNENSQVAGLLAEKKKWEETAKDLALLQQATQPFAMLASDGQSWEELAHELARLRESSEQNKSQLDGLLADKNTWEETSCELARVQESLKQNKSQLDRLLAKEKTWQETSHELTRLRYQNQLLEETHERCKERQEQHDVLKKELQKQHDALKYENCDLRRTAQAHESCKDLQDQRDQYKADSDKLAHIFRTLSRALARNPGEADFSRAVERVVRIRTRSVSANCTWTSPPQFGSYKRTMFRSRSSIYSLTRMSISLWRTVGQTGLTRDWPGMPLKTSFLQKAGL